MGAISIDKIPFSGKSMEPSLKSGDLVHVDFSENPDPQLGDIILFRQNSEWVVHRMVGDKTIHFTKGDNSPSKDSSGIGSPMGIITGFTRRNRSYSWGSYGQPFKKTMAFLSSQNDLEESRKFSVRLKRQIILKIMKIVQFGINFRMFIFAK
jgi:signal peptidase I